VRGEWPPDHGYQSGWNVRRSIRAKPNLFMTIHRADSPLTARLLHLLAAPVEPRQPTPADLQASGTPLQQQLDQARRPGVRAGLEGWRLLADARVVLQSIQAEPPVVALIRATLGGKSIDQVEAVLDAAEKMAAGRFDRAAVLDMVGPSISGPAVQALPRAANGGPLDGGWMQPRAAAGPPPPVAGAAGSDGTPRTTGSASAGPANARRFATAGSDGQPVKPVRRTRGEEPSPRPLAALRADLGPEARLTGDEGGWPLAIEFEGVRIDLCTGVQMPQSPKHCQDRYPAALPAAAEPTEAMPNPPLRMRLVWDEARKLYVLKTPDAPGTTSRELLDPPGDEAEAEAKPEADEQRIPFRAIVPRGAVGFVAEGTWAVPPARLPEAVRECVALLQAAAAGVPRSTTRAVREQALFTEALSGCRSDPLGVHPLHVLPDEASSLPERLRAYVTSCTYEADRDSYGAAAVFPEHRDRKAKAGPYLADGMPTLFVGVIDGNPEADEEDGADDEPLFVLWDAERMGLRGLQSVMYVDGALVRKARAQGYAKDTRPLQMGKGREQVFVGKREHLERMVSERLEPGARRQLFAALGIAAPPKGSLALGAAVIPWGDGAVRLHVYDHLRPYGEDALSIAPFAKGVFAERRTQAPRALEADDPRLAHIRDVVAALDEDGAVALWDAIRYDSGVEGTLLTVLKATLSRVADSAENLAVETQLRGNTGKVFVAPLEQAANALDALVKTPAVSGAERNLVDPQDNGRLLARLDVAEASPGLRPMPAIVEAGGRFGWVRLNVLLHQAQPAGGGVAQHVVDAQMPGYRGRTLESFYLRDGGTPLLMAYVDVTREHFPGARPQRVYAMWDPHAYMTEGKPLPPNLRLYVTNKAVQAALDDPRGIALPPHTMASGLVETLVVCTEARLSQAVRRRLEIGLHAEPVVEQWGRGDIVPVLGNDFSFDSSVAVHAPALYTDDVYALQDAAPDRVSIAPGRHGSLHEWIVRCLQSNDPARRLVWYVPGAAENGLAQEAAYVTGRRVAVPSEQTPVQLDSSPDRKTLLLSSSSMTTFAPPPHRVRPVVTLDGQLRLADITGRMVSRQMRDAMLGRLTQFHPEYCGFEVGDGCQIVVARREEPGAAYRAQAALLEAAGVPLQQTQLFGLPAVLFVNAPVS
jgi:hypothetical protein